jgi:general secretion pathway protein D
MTKPPLATSIVSLLGVAVSVSLLNSAVAADASRPTAYPADSSIAAREKARRTESTHAGEDLIKAGDRAMRDKDYQAAFDNYRKACDLIPNSEVTARLYSIALHDFEDAAVTLAREQIAQGEYTKAESTVKVVLHDYNPNCKKAMEILANLESPDYYHKTITPNFRAQIEQVKQYFVEAKGFLDSGRPLLAYKRCEQILAIDPYNIAALKLEEEINRKKDDYPPLRRQQRPDDSADNPHADRDQSAQTGFDHHSEDRFPRSHDSGSDHVPETEEHRSRPRAHRCEHRFEPGGWR